MINGYQGHETFIKHTCSPIGYSKLFSWHQVDPALQNLPNFMIRQSPVIGIDQILCISRLENQYLVQNSDDH